MSNKDERLKGRNKDGRFAEGNELGITDSERARKLQSLAVQSRLKNQRQRMLRVLQVIEAQDNGLDPLEMIYYNIARKALEGNTAAAKFLMQILFP